MSWTTSLRAELAKFDGRITAVFAMASVLIVTYQYYLQSPIDWLQPLLTHASVDEITLYKSLAWHIGTVAMLMVVPMVSLSLLNRFFARQCSPVRYTFTLGDYKMGLKLALLFAAVTLAIHFVLVKIGIIPVDLYPACKSSLIQRHWLVFLMFEVSQCLYMVGFEYFFRGFLLIEAQKVFGYNALAVTLLPYIMIKFGKPPVEIYTAILVGYALGYMTVRTRSFWYAALSHCLLATVVDTMAVYFE